MDKKKLPIAHDTNFMQAFDFFNNNKPNGTKIAGLAIIIEETNPEHGPAPPMWSVNYEVTDDKLFLNPKTCKISEAKEMFYKKSKATELIRIKNCTVCKIHPSNETVYKWQVLYE